MKVEVDGARQLCRETLHTLGFSGNEAESITRNVIAAELAGKDSHGLRRIVKLPDKIRQGYVRSTEEQVAVVEERPSMLVMDGKQKPGMHVIYESLETALDKAEDTAVVGVALQQIGYHSNYIGDYAREAAERDLVYLGVHNSPPTLIPYGASEPVLGTNPLTVGIPSRDEPVVLDMAASKITYGDMLDGTELSEHVALDKDGNPTVEPEEAIAGGLLPIAGPKGSGLAFIVELLSGALADSSLPGEHGDGRGAFYTVVNPAMFRNLDGFKKDVEKTIHELKAAEGDGEVRYPGERSQHLRAERLERGYFDVPEETVQRIRQLS